MKKLRFVMLAILMAVVVAGCGKSDDGFVLRPPKLHIPFKCGGRLAERVGEGDDAAVFFVDAARHSDIDDLFAC